MNSPNQTERVKVRNPTQAKKYSHITGKVFPSITNVLIISFLLGGLLMNGYFRPFVKRGFFCNDSSIYYPVKGESVPFKYMIILAFVIPIIMIKIYDKKVSCLLQDRCIYSKLFICNINRRRRRVSDHDNIQSKNMDETEDPINTNRSVKRRNVSNSDDSDPDLDQSKELCRDDSRCINVGSCFDTSLDDQEDFETKNDYVEYIKKTALVNNLRFFLFGIAITTFLTGVGKMSCGWLRPHFLDKCKPNIDCNLTENVNRYIDNFVCTANLSHREITYISTSWPSGHASIMFYSMIYMSIYFQKTLTVIAHLRANKLRDSTPIPLMVYGLYAMLMGLAIYVSLTRISDHHHHPFDVLSGALMGCIIGLILGCRLITNQD